MMPKRTDRNQREIVEALRQLGISVQVLSDVGKGCPELLCGWGHKNILIEVKVPGCYLNKREHDWHHGWRGQADIAHSIEEAVAIIQENDE